jgi:hypothetical protein
MEAMEQRQQAGVAREKGGGAWRFQFFTLVGRSP